MGTATGGRRCQCGGGLDWRTGRQCEQGLDREGWTKGKETIGIQKIETF